MAPGESNENDSQNSPGDVRRGVADELPRDGLQLLVVLDRAMVPAGQEQQPLRLACRLVDLLAHGVGDPLVAASVHQEQGGLRAEPAGRLVDVERLEPRLACVRVAGEVRDADRSEESAAGRPPGQGRWRPRRRPARHVRPAPPRGSPGSRPCSTLGARREAHARATARPSPARRRTRSARSFPRSARGRARRRRAPPSRRPGSRARSRSGSPWPIPPRAGSRPPHRARNRARTARRTGRRGCPARAAWASSTASLTS